MSKRFIAQLVALLVLCVYVTFAYAAAGWYYDVGTGTTNGTPIAVGTATAVEIFAYNFNRYGGSLYSDSADLFCAWSNSTAVPTPEATASGGFRLPGKTLINLSQIFQSASGTLPYNTQARIDCVSQTGSTNVSTSELWNQ